MYGDFYLATTPKIVRWFLNRWGTFLTAFTAVETHLMGIFCDTLHWD